MYRKTLRDLVSAARKVIPNTSDLPELCNVWFYKGRLCGTNGMEWFSFSLSTSAKLDCGVNAAKLENLLKNVEQDEIELSYEEPYLIIETGEAPISLRAWRAPDYAPIFDLIPDAKKEAYKIPASKDDKKTLQRAQKSTTMTGTLGDQRCWMGIYDEDFVYILTNRVSIATRLPNGWYFEEPVSQMDVVGLLNNLQEVPYSFVRAANGVMNKLNPDSFGVQADPESGVYFSMEPGIGVVGSLPLELDMPKGMTRALTDTLGSSAPLRTIPKSFRPIVERVKSVSGETGTSCRIGISVEEGILAVNTIDEEHGEQIELEDHVMDGVRGTVLAESLSKSLFWATDWCVQDHSLLLTDFDLISMIHFMRER